MNASHLDQPDEWTPSVPTAPIPREQKPQSEKPCPIAGVPRTAPADESRTEYRRELHSIPNFAQKKVRVGWIGGLRLSCLMSRGSKLGPRTPILVVSCSAGPGLCAVRSLEKGSQSTHHESKACGRSHQVAGASDEGRGRGREPTSGRREVSRRPASGGLSSRRARDGLSAAKGAVLDGASSRLGDGSGGRGSGLLDETTSDTIGGRALLEVHILRAAPRLLVLITGAVVSVIARACGNRQLFSSRKGSGRSTHCQTCWGSKFRTPRGCSSGPGRRWTRRPGTQRRKPARKYHPRHTPPATVGMPGRRGRRGRGQRSLRGKACRAWAQRRRAPQGRGPPMRRRTWRALWNRVRWTLAGVGWTAKLSRRDCRSAVSGAGIN